MSDACTAGAGACTDVAGACTDRVGQGGMNKLI